MKRFALLTACVFTILPFLGFSASPLRFTVPVTGRVTNSSGAPLAGVSIQQKGSTAGTSTGADGNFSLEVSDSSAILVFSYIGYQTQELALNGRSKLDVSMANETANLNDVVVIGYQSVRRKDLTGATGVVNMAEAAKVTATSPVEAIQGLVPGVTVRNSGAPGANPVVEIRGVASFTNSSPLYVIDGMLADANSTINSNDIASMQVLKDASAAAIYGSRAGNGVIIITTKKGKEGPAKFSFSAKAGLQQIPKRWDVMSADRYLTTVQTEYQNSGVALPAGISAQLNSPAFRTDWQDEVMRTGNDQDYNLSVSGGSKTSSFLISGSYYKNQGVLIGNDFQRASVRINTETRRGRLTVGENILLSNTLGNNPGGGVNAFYESASMLPVVGVKDPQYNTIPSNPAGWGFGTNEVPTYASNYVAVNALDKIHYTYAKLIGNAYADLKFTDWLSYRFNMGAELSFDYSKEVRDTGIWRYNNQPPNTSVGEDREQFSNFLLEHTLNFNKTFGEHALSAVVGFSRTQQRRDITQGGRSFLQGSGDAGLTTIGSALGTATAGGSTPVFWRQHGWLGRINYVYADKYLLTLTGRIDQDTRFGEDFRTGYFPSIAAAWRLSKEEFFKVSWIDDLKIRASWGRLGISSGLDNLGSWPALAALNNSPRAVYGVSQTPLIGQYQSVLTNPDLHWETREEKNIGFDASLFRNRVSVAFDVYNSLSRDVLVSQRVGQYLGVVGGTVTNAASIRNTGVEAAITYRSADRPFRWEISGNFTTINNKVVSVGSQGVDATGTKVDYVEPTNFIRAQVGHSIGQWYVIKTDGIFQNQQEVTAYVNKDGTVIQPNAKPGDIKYADRNGDGTINNDDRQYVGSPWPTLQAGAQFNASYKHLNLNIQLIGVFGSKIYNDVRHVLDGYQLTNFRSDIHPWSADEPSGKDPRLAVDVPGDPTVSVNNFAQTSRWLENGSYVRLRNLEIGYTFQTGLLQRTGISDARIYISGQNLLTLTKYKGMDPDVQGASILERGFDNGNWPPSRVISAGLQFGF